ncbi:hypothetical protein [Methylobacterium sp.]|jgi:hypothetical protein|uniref:hypothetical protein n=1 Tax=Methylobacterium sp. TaxID=409 RepID=UPI00257D54B1|nr:hypothetical protein [Methylobacterium sp.]
MPFLSLTKGAKRAGIQTFAKASLLMPELRGVEIEYLDARDWYVNQVNVITQIKEALDQAKAGKNELDVADLGRSLHAEESKLKDVRERVRSAGERSWAEAFHLAATIMLSHENMRALEEETDRLLGRPRHELGQSK